MTIHHTITFQVFYQKEHLKDHNLQLSDKALSIWMWYNITNHVNSTRKNRKLMNI